VDLKKLGQNVLPPHGVDLGARRDLVVDVWDTPAHGRRLTTKRFSFIHLDVDAYAATGDLGYDPGTGVFWIVIRHLGTGLGTGYIEDVIARVAGLSQPATTEGDAKGGLCKISGNDGYFFWFSVDPKTPMVAWSVKVGRKDNAFSGTYTINAEAKEKEKEKE